MNQFCIAVLIFAVPWALDAIVYRLVATADADPIRDALRAWDRRVGPRRRQVPAGAVLFLPATERRASCRRCVSRWQKLRNVRLPPGLFDLAGFADRLRLAARLRPSFAPPRVLGQRALVAMASAGIVVSGLSTFDDPTLRIPITWAASFHPAQPLPGDPRRTPPSHAEQRDWTAFRARFIQPDGRVVDNGNDGVSHTESQGEGMLFAVAFNDRPTFDRIWNWTRTHLRRDGDRLHAWRYVTGSANPVPDTNNATDGDIYIAAALVRAANLWNASAYFAAGYAIAHDIRRLLIRNVGGRTVLLPALKGFASNDHVEINLSYNIFPLLADLQAADPSPTWQKLIDDSRVLDAEARFGQWQLPPDWLDVATANGAISISRRQPPRFSFDAVRVPLFLAWDHAGPAALATFATYWGQNPAAAPAWVDLTNGAQAPYTTTGGMLAIAELTSKPGSLDQADLPSISPRDDYYSASLILLSRLALRETMAQDHVLASSLR